MKNLIVSAVIAALVGVSGSALADCDAHEYLDAKEQTAFCFTASSAVVFDRDNGWQAVCLAADGSELGTVFDLAERRCDAATLEWEAMGLTEADIGGYGGMYEACMRLETGSRIPMGDGSFWR